MLTLDWDVDGSVRMRVSRGTISDRELEVSLFPQVAWLDISDTGVTDAGLASVGRLRRLRFLDLSGSAVTGPGLEDLARLSSLRVLRLCRLKLDETAFGIIATMGELQELDLSAMRTLTRSGLAAVNKLKKLQVLSCAQTPVTAEWLDELRGNRSLRRLDLRATRISDAGVKTLASLEKLSWLDMSQSKVTEPGLIELIRSTKALRTLCCFGIRLSDKCLKALGEMHAFHELYLADALTGNAGVTDKGIQELWKLPGLQVLVLGSTESEVSAASLRGIEKLERLRHLDLAGNHVGDEGARHIAKCRALEFVDLSGSQLTDLGLSHLIANKQLRTIVVTNTAVTEEGVRDALKRRPDLLINY